MDNATRSQPDFQRFFQTWLTHQELYLHQLLHLIQSPDQQDESKLRQLIRRVMTHYHQYYHAKAEVSHRNVFLVLSPPWFSSYKRTFFWLAGFKPGLAIHVVKRCEAELSSGQSEMIERLTAETKDEEREIVERLARLEERLSSPAMLALARMGGRELHGMVQDADTAVERMATEMEVLVGCGLFEDEDRGESGGDTDNGANGEVLGGHGGAAVED